MSTSMNSLEAKFLVEAAKLKLLEITKQLEKEQTQTCNRKSIAKLYTDFLEEWLLEQKSLAKDNVRFPSVYNLPLSLEDYDRLKQLKEETIDAVMEKMNHKVKSTDMNSENETLLKYETLLLSLFTDEEELQVLRSNTKAFCVNTLDESIKPEEVQEAATTLLKSRELDPEERNLLEKVEEEDEKLTAEYCSILTILLKNFEDWSWGEENLQGKMIYFHRVNSKFRLLANEQIAQAMFLEVLGSRLKKYITNGESARGNTNAFGEIHRSAWDDHIKKRPEMDPRDLINNDRELKHFYEQEVQDKYFMATITTNEEGNNESEYSSGLSGNNIGMLLATLVRFNEKFPSEKGEKLAILKTDIKDCGLLNNNNMNIYFMVGYGTPHVISPQNGKGTLFAHTISYVLTELVLACVDIQLIKKGYPIARIHDDFVLCARGEKCMTQGLSALTEALVEVGGLELNLEKTSYVLLDHPSNAADNSECIDGSPLKNLRNEIYWQGLKLDSSGEWSVIDDLFEKVLFPLVRENVSIPLTEDSEPNRYVISLFSIINNYNTQMKRIQTMLGPISDAFGYKHAQLVLETLCEAEKYLCGGANNLSTWLMAELKNRFPDLLLDIPEGWFYWSISAGGLLAEHSKIRTEGLLEEFNGGARKRTYFNAFRPTTPVAYEEYLTVKEEYCQRNPGYGFANKVRKELAMAEEKRYKSHKLEEDGYGFNSSEFEKCVDFESECRSYRSSLKSGLTKLVDLNNVKEGCGPQKLDKPTKKMINDFCSKTSDFANFGGYETSGLGYYMKRIVAEYGSDLQETFGNLGLIPSDLVPHNLLNNIRRTNVSKEL
eukprot:Awhi_evm1s14825